MDESYLAGRFCRLWTDCGGADPEGHWQQLRGHYTEPHRHYHSLGHLAQCLRELDGARHHVAEFQATEMALWFHDVIYVYGARDNEARSAEYFRAAAAEQMPSAFGSRSPTWR